MKNLHQFGDRYRLTIEHTESSYLVPEIDWGENTSYYSLIGWGDGYYDPFTPNLYYEYNDGSSSKHVDICSDVLPETVVLHSIKGVNNIDLTYFKSNQ